MCRIMLNIQRTRWRRARTERGILERERAHVDCGSLFSPRRAHAAHAPEQRWIEESVSSQVVLAIQTLPLHYRRVVLLADLMDFSYAEIARTIGCPVGTVMSRLHRGRKRLQVRLEGYAAEAYGLAA